MKLKFKEIKEVKKGELVGITVKSEEMCRNLRIPKGKMAKGESS